MILVDTSIWIHHLRKGNERLQGLLGTDHVWCHPFVIGELACGNLNRREEILGLLMALPEVRLAEHHEVLHLIELRRLYGRGLGWVDAHLLTSALLMHCTLWTLDQNLHTAAATLGLSD